MRNVALNRGRCHTDGRRRRCCRACRGRRGGARRGGGGRIGRGLSGGGGCRGRVGRGSGVGRGLRGGGRCRGRVGGGVGGGVCRNRGESRGRRNGKLRHCAYGEHSDFAGSGAARGGLQHTDLERRR